MIAGTVVVGLGRERGSRARIQRRADVSQAAEAASCCLSVFAEKGERAAGIDDMVAHLKRRGVAAEVVRFSTGEGDIGKTILAKAKELHADMIVMGAFHHSRWREFILGGVTLTMLEEATIPLFMAH